MRGLRLSLLSAVAIVIALGAIQGSLSQTKNRRAARPTYKDLEKHFSKDKHECPDIATSPNQCAVRVSRALIGAGTKMDSDYKGKLCRHGYARGAQDLGAFVKVKWGNPDQSYEKPGSAPAKIKGKKGVIMFAEIPDFDGQGHIDLWDGQQGLTGDYWNAKLIWFWELK